MSHASNRPSLPILTEEEVARLVSVEDALDTVERTFAAYGRHRNVLSDPPAMSITPAGGQAVFKLKGAHLPDIGITGSRIIADRRSQGEEQSIDYCWVADGATGAPLGLVSEGWLHRLRTAVTGVVAARLLARPESAVAVIVGAGRIADELPAAIRASFPITELRVVARRTASAEAFAARHGAAGRIVPMTDLDVAADGADLIFGISAAETPVIEARHMAPGRFVCGMGGGAEIAMAAMETADRFIVDEFDYAAMIGSVKGWIDAGADPAAIAARLDADIGEIAAGTKPGRGTPEAAILAIIQGMACCDLALAHLALTRAGLVEAVA
ncbi:hypothetical protein L1787_15375 [Acuticoccus sp. M5D2P5]|uniref:hypothetical protein n=1 Tax=Acuticoccus kalidii TaxID=2910977 RepID=UPI001F4447BF|nr:hypothetical protein [Acuticoccus kalidii]MCF3934783.1 hypothetical protein [Acuticoccus kalidii]